MRDTESVATFLAARSAAFEAIFAALGVAVPGPGRHDPRRTLAHALGRSQSFVTKYESSRRRLDIVEFDRICGALEVTLEECVRRSTSR
jgi:hypothetical protein